MRYVLMMIPALAFACGTPDGDDDMAADAQMDTTSVGAATGPAMAVLHDSTGREVGRINLTQSDSGISVVGRVIGFAQGERAIHIHTVGSCSPTFAAAGGHWNPTARAHGSDNPDGAHLGDLGNLHFQSDSTTQVDFVTAGGQLRGVDGVLDSDGATLVLHAGADDNRTDPDGASGARIACGAIQ